MVQCSRVVLSAAQSDLRPSSPPSVFDLLPKHLRDQFDDATGTIMGRTPYQVLYLLTKAKYKYARDQQEELVAELAKAKMEMSRMTEDKERLVDDVLRALGGPEADKFILPIPPPDAGVDTRREGSLYMKQGHIWLWVLMATAFDAITYIWRQCSSTVVALIEQYWISRKAVSLESTNHAHLCFGQARVHFLPTVVLTNVDVPSNRGAISCRYLHVICGMPVVPIPDGWPIRRGRCRLATAIFAKPGNCASGHPSF
ncbi:hypothetical protein AB1N83_009935 [Pleurotus pulmonarius]